MLVALVLILLLFALVGGFAINHLLFALILLAVLIVIIDR